jgi:GT2 family glycosyltransferase
VDWLSGACLIARAEAVAEAGAYDAALLPMYAEDLDWCWRMRRAGWEVWFDASAVLTHLENATPMDDRAVVMQRASYDFVRARYPAQRWPGIRAGTAAGHALRWMLARDPGQRLIHRRLVAMPV